VIPPSGIPLNPPTAPIGNPVQPGVAAVAPLSVAPPVAPPVEPRPQPEVRPEPTPAPVLAAPIPSVSPRRTNDIATWLHEHGWSPPHPVSHGREVRYETEGGGGRFAVTIGQKEAEWNGLRLWLGFEPRLVAGRLWMHPLDIEAHVEPLLGEPRWQAPVRSIVIDPGHGGRQPGTRSILGNQFEKDLTLDWAIRLRALLEARGWKVTLTRTNDLDLTLAERVDLAEAAGAAVFVSLHFNSSFPSQQAAGLETYCLTPRGMASHVVREYADEVGRSFPNNIHDADNLRIAAAVHRSLVATAGAGDRAIRHARFMDVLRWQNRPAILVEGGYLSNPEEARRIQTPEYRQRLAEGVAAAFP
jgi:N-acetylmuramoyl-L-alanine amidase